MTSDPGENLYSIRFELRSFEVIRRLSREGYSKSQVIRDSITGLTDDEGAGDYEWLDRAEEIDDIRRRVEDEDVREFFYDLSYLAGGLEDALIGLELPTHEQHKEDFNEFCDKYLRDYRIVEEYQNFTEHEVEDFVDEAENLFTDRFRTAVIFSDEREKWEEEIDRFEEEYLQDDYIHDLLR